MTQGLSPQANQADQQTSVIENREDGWIKLYRSSISKGWLSNHRLWTFWCWCLLKASHREYTTFIGNHRVTLSPGQFVFTLRNAAKELKMTLRQTRTCIDSMRRLQNLTHKTTHHYSVVTITNWDVYQGWGKENDTANDIRPTHDRHINKNVKNRKNNTPDFQSVLDYYLSRVEETRGFKPEFTKQDFPMLKSALKKHGKDRVINFILFFLDSEKSEKHISLAAALSADTINQYNMKWQKAKYQYGDDAEIPTGETRWWV